MTSQLRLSTPNLRSPGLRLYDGEQTGDSGDTIVQEPNTTLRDALNRVMLPHLKRQKRAADTIQSYDRYVRKFEEFCQQLPDYGGEKYGTLCPVPSFRSDCVHSIDRQLMTAFQAWLVEGNGFSNRNNNKYVGGVEAILGQCERTELAELKITTAPRIDKLPEDKAAPKLYLRFLTQRELDRPSCSKTRPHEHDELSKLYQAAEIAWWPTHDRDGNDLDPVMQWKCALVLYCLYGFRTEELIAYSTLKVEPLNWSQISFNATHPQAHCHGENDHGWLWYVPEKQRGTKTEPLTLPLAKVARQHLEAIGGPKKSGKIFNWPLNKNGFYPVFYAIVKRAGLQQKLNLKSGNKLKLVPGNMRKTCDTWHNYFTPGIAQFITGHASSRDPGPIIAKRCEQSQIVATHYDNPEMLIRDHFETRLPIPQAWQRIPSGRQLRLF